MSLTVEEQHRQKIKDRSVVYNAANKDVRRLASRVQAKARTLETTARRIEGHTLDELIKIAELCCKNRHDEFLAKRDAIIDVLQFLHASNNVLSATSFDDIFSQELSQILSSDQENSKSHD